MKPVYAILVNEIYYDYLPYVHHKAFTTRKAAEEELEKIVQEYKDQSSFALTWVEEDLQLLDEMENTVVAYEIFKSELG